MLVLHPIWCKDLRRITLGKYPLQKTGDRLNWYTLKVVIQKKMPFTVKNILKHFMGRCFWKTASNLIWRGEESQSGSSKADFANKVRISLREMRESNFWLRIIKRTVPEVNPVELDYLIKESYELKSILGSIIQKMR